MNTDNMTKTVELNEEEIKHLLNLLDFQRWALNNCRICHVYGQECEHYLSIGVKLK